MSSGSTKNVNFANYSGYTSVAAAIVFVVLYSPLFLLFTKKVFSQPTYVHVVMSMALFCAIRVTAFVIRAVMIKVESAGENRGLFIGDQILFGIGYASLLYSGYILILDLYVFFGRVFDITERLGMFTTRASEVHRKSTNKHHILRLLTSRYIFSLAMITAVTLDIVATSTISYTGTSGPTAVTLREVSTAIFLALTVLLFFQTISLASADLSEARGVATFGAKHGIFILLLISLFLLIREVFTTVTVTPSRHATQMDEHFWYPLVVLPEILAVILFLTPGLVPSREEFSEREQDRVKNDSQG